jgi:hypothetical protein
MTTATTGVTTISTVRTDADAVVGSGPIPAGQDRAQAAAIHRTSMNPHNAEPTRPTWRRAFPATARTRIIAWVLLLVMVALGLVTFVTWPLLVSATNMRMEEALRFEVEEFGELTTPGVNPRTGEAFRTVDEVIREAIAYNIARPNEKFLGYINGEYRTQSRQEPGAQEVLARDPESPVTPVCNRTAAARSCARRTARCPLARSRGRYPSSCSRRTVRRDRMRTC